MCNDESALCSIEEKVSEMTFAIGYGSDLAITGIGIVRETKVVQGEMREVLLKDVLLVPKRSCSLISVGRCRRNGVGVTFDSRWNGRACTADHIHTS